MSAPQSSSQRYYISASQLSTLGLICNNLDIALIIGSNSPQCKEQIKNSIEAIASLIKFIREQSLESLQGDSSCLT